MVESVLIEDEGHSISPATLDVELVAVGRVDGQLFGRDVAIFKQQGFELGESSLFSVELKIAITQELLAKITFLIFKLDLLDFRDLELLRI